MLALRWWRSHAARGWLVAYLAAFGAGLAGFLAATRGPGATVLYCDVATVAHAAMFAAIAAVVTALALPRALSKPVLLVGLAFAGLAGIAVFALVSPQCLRTPFGALDPVVRDFWYVNVAEGQPYWQQPAALYPALVSIVVALGVSLRLWRRGREWRKRWWCEYSLLLGGMIVLGLLVSRSMAFASLLAALPLGYLLAGGLARLREPGPLAGRLAIAAALLVVLVPSVPFGLGSRAMAANTAGNANLEMTKSTCDLADSARALARLEPGTVFAPLDIGPSVVLYSPHAVVATGHHRAELAMRDVILAFTGTPERARTLIAKHEARYVVMCSDLIEPDVYVERGVPGNFASLLRDGRAPSWLEPVALGTPPTFRVWRVVN